MELAAKGCVRVKLKNSELWEQFNRIGTEMILTKSGRRMFPYLSIAIEGLSSEFKYVVMVDMARIDLKKYKFVDQSQQWLPVSPHEYPDVMSVGALCHQGCPLTSHSLEAGILFNKLKLTNALKEDMEDQILLESMHRYAPRIHVMAEQDFANKDWTRALVFTFQETEFIAVTAYMNKQITQLKIQNNPFARAFREPKLKKRAFMDTISVDTSSNDVNVKSGTPRLDVPKVTEETEPLAYKVQEDRRGLDAIVGDTISKDMDDMSTDSQATYETKPLVYSVQAKQGKSRNLLTTSSLTPSGQKEQQSERFSIE